MTASSSPDQRDDALLDWFGVRTIFHWVNRASFEERVTLWKATSFEDAIAQAEVEALEYETPEVRYLGFAQAYNTKMDDVPIRPSFEAFSLVRSSDLDPNEYVTRFFDTGDEFGSTLAANR